MPLNPYPPHRILSDVSNALMEDMGNGDLTAQLIPENSTAQATIITRQDMILCGSPWFETCFRTLDAECEVLWKAKEGDAARANQTLCEVRGKARALLTA